MTIKNLKSKKLKECEGKEFFLNLENMDVLCDFPYPDDGVTFRTKILEIILDGDVINPDNVLNDEDMEDILDQVQTVIVTESEKKKKTSHKQLFENRKRTNQKGLKLSEVLKKMYSQIQ